MTSPADRYDRWKAPAEDGQVLIWPPPTGLLAQADENHRRLAAADSIQLQNVPISEARRAMRTSIGHDDARPLFATGHQTELYHPGVWVKDALIDAAAKRAGGDAYHFAVDTDTPKHLHVRWPGGAAPLTDNAVESAEWSGQLKPPSPEHLDRIAERFGATATAWDFRPLVPDFIQDLRRLSTGAKDLPSALTGALHEIDHRLGLRQRTLLVSPICCSEPYLLFVHHVCARADYFARDYNLSLEEYRTRNKIRSPGRPMPDLKCTRDGCEVPFWLDHLATGARSRATVAKVEGGFALKLENGDSFFFDAKADGWTATGRLLAWLRDRQIRLSPRALTLTAVLRLLAADQFVHGIGGGQYDQVLDGLIARHFRLDPPRFSVTTATLYFPLAANRPRVCLPCLAHEGHVLRHAVLGAEKMRMVGLIEALPRHSAERSTLFFQMHDKLSAAWAGPRGRAWEERVRNNETLAQEERAVFNRELFYAIQPASRLSMLIEKCRAAFD